VENNSTSYNSTSYHQDISNVGKSLGLYNNNDKENGHCIQNQYSKNSNSKLSLDGFQKQCVPVDLTQTKLDLKKNPLAQNSKDLFRQNSKQIQDDLLQREGSNNKPEADGSNNLHRTNAATSQCIIKQRPDSFDTASLVSNHASGGKRQAQCESGDAINHEAVASAPNASYDYEDACDEDGTGEYLDDEEEAKGAFRRNRDGGNVLIDIILRLFCRETVDARDAVVIRMLLKYV